MCPSSQKKKNKPNLKSVEVSNNKAEASEMGIKCPCQVQRNIQSVFGKDKQD